MLSKRFLIVPVLSSAARIPFPFVTIACAICSNACLFIAISPLSQCQRFHAGKPFAFKPFQKCAASCRDIGKCLGHACMV